MSVSDSVISNKKFIRKKIKIYSSITNDNIKLDHVRIQKPFVNKNPNRITLSNRPVSQINDLDFFIDYTTISTQLSTLFEASKVTLPKVNVIDINNPSTSSDYLKNKRQEAKKIKIAKKIIVGNDLYSYGHFTILPEMQPKITLLGEVIKKLGGVITSAGGLRDAVSLIKKRASFHIIGRAIDLGIYTGLSSMFGTYPYTQYIVSKDTMSERSGFTVWCPVNKNAEGFDSDFYKKAMNIEGFISYSTQGHEWTSTSGFRPYTYQGEVFNLTAVLNSFGFTRIRPLKTFVSNKNYGHSEWWHYECHEGLTPGKTTTADVVLRIWTEEKIKKLFMDSDPIYGEQNFYNRMNEVWNGDFFA
jgi:hypothetical protein